jgi:glycosyltransferase involved in cell wall biosynthesis
MLVIACHEPLWRGLEDRLQAAGGGWKKPGFLWSAVRAYLRLAWRGLRLPAYDLLLASYPGMVDVLLAWVLSRLRRRPLAWDILMSTSLIARERGLDRQSPFTNKLLAWVEKTALRLPERLILDTPEHIAWFGKTFGAPAGRFRLLPLGADDDLFPHLPPASPEGVFRVVYYGSFIPNHGTPYIVEAARLLRETPGILFELAGEGPDLAHCRELAAKYRLENLSFLPWLSRPALTSRLAGAGACLGAFGQTPMSLMTVHNKIYEALALGLPVITGESPAVSQMLQPGAHLLTCDRSDPQSLADAVLRLKRNPALRSELAAAGNQFYREHYSLARRSKQMGEYMIEIAKNQSRP